MRAKQGTVLYLAKQALGGKDYIVKFLSLITAFLKEVRLEIKKVNWLAKREVFRYTVIVIVFSLSVAIYLGALDFVFQFVLARI